MRSDSTSTDWKQLGKTKRGHITFQTFDRLDRLTTVAHPSIVNDTTGETVTAVERFTFDGVGNMTSRTDRRGNRTDYAYDGLNRMVTQTDPSISSADRGTWINEYDDAGNLVAAVDPSGARVEATFDSFDRTRTRTAIVRNGDSDPFRFTTSFDYDDLGNTTLERSPLGDITRAQFSPASELIEITDAANEVTTFEYDVAGRQVASVDPLGRRVETEFDLAGRPIAAAALDPAGAEVTRSTATFDPLGNPLTQVAPRGHVPGNDPLDYTTTFEYDAVGRLASIEQPGSPDPIGSTYRYDLAGNLTGLVDGRSNTTTYGYNAWGLRTTLVEAQTAAHPDLEDRTWTTNYDAGGLPISTFEPGDVTVLRAFDELGRMVEETGSGPAAPPATRTFQFDAAGYLVGAGSPVGEMSFEYDDRGLLTSSAGAPQVEASFQYDAVGRMIARTDAAGVSTFTWTARNELETSTDSLSGTTRANTFDPAGQLQRVDYSAGSDSSARVLTYDGIGRIATDVLTDDAGATSASYGYSYDADSNVVSKSVVLPGNSASGDHTYEYDGVGRLASWTDPADVAHDYDFDAAGNLVNNAGTSQVFDERNRLIQAGDTTQTWTQRGTLSTTATTQIVDGSPITVTEGYVFDGLGRAAVTPSGSFSYDSFDRISVADGVDFGFAGFEIDPSRSAKRSSHARPAALHSPNRRASTRRCSSVGIATETSDSRTTQADRSTRQRFSTRWGPSSRRPEPAPLSVSKATTPIRCRATSGWVPVGIARARAASRLATPCSEYSKPRCR